MKLIKIVPFAALTTAFVIPDERVMSEVRIESHGKAKSVVDKVPTKAQATTEFENTFSKLIDTSKSTFDQAIDYAAESGEVISIKAHETAFDAQTWLEVGGSWFSCTGSDFKQLLESAYSLPHAALL